MMRQLIRSGVLLLSLPFFAACATTMKEAAEVPAGKVLPLVSAAKGLPTEGLWRQDSALFDMNGDGLLDIVLPPPRKAKEGQARPFIFIYDAKEGRWAEGNYTFPPAKGYDYGGVAVGDLNKDGLPDIVLATHARDILILLNDGKGGFTLSTLAVGGEFHSRSVMLVDVNGDGWLDIVALSEASFSGKYTPRGLLVAMNDEGKGWKVQIQEGGLEIFGDSLSQGDFTGSGKIDIAIAPKSFKEEDKKMLWLNDGKGSFRFHLAEAALVGNNAPFIVRAGDIDGDGRAEAVYTLSGMGEGSTLTLAAYRWTGSGMQQISAGLDQIRHPIAFDLCDIDRDGKKELIVLSVQGIGIYKYENDRWNGIGSYPIPEKEARSVFNLRAALQPDGSLLIVYNLGAENPDLAKGIRALVLK